MATTYQAATSVTWLLLRWFLLLLSSVGTEAIGRGRLLECCVGTIGYLGLTDRMHLTHRIKMGK